MAGKRIFVVDDDEKIRLMISTLLRNNGFEVVVAANGADALYAIPVTQPHLIVMDIVLPDLDGPEVVRQLKENPKAAKIPVLFLSGIAKESGHDDVLVDGVYYPAIGKPFDQKKFVSLIKEILP